MALQFQPHRFERTAPAGLRIWSKTIMLADGNTVGFVTNYTDITDNKQRESALAEKTALLQTLIDNLPSGVGVSTEPQAWF